MRAQSHPLAMRTEAAPWGLWARSPSRGERTALHAGSSTSARALLGPSVSPASHGSKPALRSIRRSALENDSLAGTSLLFWHPLHWDRCGEHGHPFPSPSVPSSLEQPGCGRAWWSTSPMPAARTSVMAACQWVWVGQIRTTLLQPHRP